MNRKIVDSRWTTASILSNRTKRLTVGRKVNTTMKKSDPAGPRAKSVCLGTGGHTKTQKPSRNTTTMAFRTALSILAATLATATACSKKHKQDDCLALYAKLTSCKKNFPIRKKEFVGLCRERHSDPVVTAQLGCSPSMDCTAFQNCLDKARIKGALSRLEKDLAAPEGRGKVTDLLLRCSRLRKSLSQQDWNLCKKRAQRAFDQAAAKVKKMRDRADASNLWQICGAIQQASKLLGNAQKRNARILCDEAKAAPAFHAVLLSKAESPDRKRACQEATKALEKLKDSTWARNQAPLVLLHCMGLKSGSPMMRPHLILSLHRDGTMTLQGQTINSLADLPGVLAKAHEAAPKVALVIENGKGASYAELVAILDEARKAGFKKLGLSDKPMVDAPPKKTRSPRPSR